MVIPHDTKRNAFRALNLRAGEWACQLAAHTHNSAFLI
jgi:hypothetical protein